MMDTPLSWNSSLKLAEVRLSHKNNHIYGHGSTLALAVTLSDSCFQTRSSQIVVVPSNQEAHKLKDHLNFVAPQIHCEILKSTDISPFSGLQPPPRTSSERMHWLHLARKKHSSSVLIAPITAFLQKTTPLNILENKTFTLKVGDEIPSLVKTFKELGYIATAHVEDIGQFSIKGGILDIYTPSYARPVRIELFGDEIESLRFFNLDHQRSLEKISEVELIPCREICYNSENLDGIIKRFHQYKNPHADKDWVRHQVQNLSQEKVLPEAEFALPIIYEKPGSPIDFIHKDNDLWIFDPFKIEKEVHNLWEEQRKDLEQIAPESFQYPIEAFYELSLENLLQNNSISTTFVERLNLENPSEDSSISLQISSLPELKTLNKEKNEKERLKLFTKKFHQWHSSRTGVFISVGHHTHLQKIEHLLKKINVKSKAIKGSHRDWFIWREEIIQSPDPLVYILEGQISESLSNEEDQIVFLNEKDLLGRQSLHQRQKTSQEVFQEKASLLSFADLKVGDHVVHKEHGIGIYQGLKMISIQGLENEFIEVSYKKDDKLYIPTYRVALLQKYSGPGHVTLDQLGTNKWQEKKTSTQKHLRDLASELLTLYAKRAESKRKPYTPLDENYSQFEKEFPYSETEDQVKAIDDIQEDLSKDFPMDRLLCGDVGFGKTEVALRAAFRVVKDKKQVILLAPTTILTFQHHESLRERFKKWPYKSELINRFISPTQIKKTIEDFNQKKIDILIGTHKILNAKIDFTNTGLLVIDEEQKFGVAHKEKIRKLKSNLDTLSLSATPIPRTLNLSLSGLRQLSLINTAPVNRHPVRTFVTQFQKETIHKAVMAEIARDGQVFFLHNRVQSIENITEELREFLPNIRIAIAHGQMNEKKLEETVMDFFKHKIDLLVCTTIIESGIDIPNANTMIINNAQNLGLSQLYQLRGRVGRSHHKAYCYLLIPNRRSLDAIAQERLRIIQENSKFGSGLLIAQYDLELRGSGSILGQDQSGQITSVGYELYMELLDSEIKRLKGEPVEAFDIEPEINLQISALIPDNYIKDIRTRLSYYKKFTTIETQGDADQMEDELKDLFGDLPEPVIHLIGIMLIRSLCKKLRITDVSKGRKNLSITFHKETTIKPEKILSLIEETKDNEDGKIQLSGTHKISISMKDMSWSDVHSKISELFKTQS